MEKASIAKIRIQGFSEEGDIFQNVQNYSISLHGIQYCLRQMVTN